MDVSDTVMQVGVLDSHVENEYPSNLRAPVAERPGYGLSTGHALGVNVRTMRPFCVPVTAVTLGPGDGACVSSIDAISIAPGPIGTSKWRTLGLGPPP